MAKRNSGRRARSRKRRSPAAAVVTGHAGASGVAAGERAGEHGRTAASQSGRTRSRPAHARSRSRALGDSQALGERPRPSWHPLPLAELLILVGFAGIAVGLARKDLATVLAGVVAALLGTTEFSWREHRAGFRSHALLLALMPTVAFHSVVILLLGAFVELPRAVNFALLPLDVALAFFLFKVLRASFQDARRERRLAEAL